jgi:Icc-related predicted phosphoesterase
MDDVRNREALMPLDAILGCGDLEPDYLAFLADGFGAPLLYVRGNHDRDAGWGVHSAGLPDPLDNRTETIEGITVAGLSWPGKDRGRAERDGTAAWWQAVGAVARAKLGGRRPDIVISHVPPRGLGDAPEDDYHRGFSAYHWLCRTLNPRLWLHGHTTAASTTSWQTTWGTTVLVNVTGGVLIEIDRAGAGNRG